MKEVLKIKLSNVSLVALFFILSTSFVLFNLTFVEKINTLTFDLERTYLLFGETIYSYEKQSSFSRMLEEQEIEIQGEVSLSTVKKGNFLWRPVKVQSDGQDILLFSNSLAYVLGPAPDPIKQRVLHFFLEETRNDNVDWEEANQSAIEFYQELEQAGKTGQ